MLLCIAVIPEAFAYNFQSGGIYYDITGSSPNTVAVTYATGSFNSYSGTVDIPGSVTYNGTTYTVTAIGNSAFRNCSGLTGVSIPGTVTSIGEYAFYGCSELTSVTIPGTVTSIGESAFYGCSGLTSVTIPNGVETIGADAFHYCGNLHNVSLPGSLTTIGASAFERAGLYSVTIPTAVSYIGSNAFRQCNSMTSVVFNAINCTSASQAFYGCNSLSSITIGNSVHTIPSFTFSNCNALRSVYIPHDINNIGTNPFANCVNLDTIVVAGGNSVFSSGTNSSYIVNTTTHNLVTGCKRTVIPNSVTAIGGYAFSGCTGLTGALTIPNQITVIGANAYSGCSGLTSVTIGHSVDSIGNDAFYQCTAIASVSFNADSCRYSYCLFNSCSGFSTLTIGSNVKAIPASSFYRCNHLTGMLVIPNSVKTIGGYAFEGCTGLTLLSIGNAVTSIGDRAFYDCINMGGTLTIPQSVKTIGSSAFSSCTSFSAIVFNADSCTTGSLSGCSNVTSLNIGNNVKVIPDYAFYGLNITGTLTIPNSVKNIGKYAFQSCGGLMGALIIPNSVLTIGQSAFSNCSGLTSLTIGNAVSTIGSNAFSNCSGLTSLTIGNAVSTIGSNAFSNCTGLASVVFNADSCISMGSYDKVFSGCTGAVTLTIGNNVKVIPTDAFYGFTGLTGALTIPDSVKSIGNYAFKNCSGLTSLTIGNAVSTIGFGAFSNCTGLTSVAFNADSCTNTGNNPSYGAFSGCTIAATLSIGDNVKSIPAYMFNGFTGLTGVLTIPDSVKSIGDCAFQNCSGLTSLTIGNAVSTIGYNAFSNCTGLTSVAFNADSCTNMGNDYSKPVFSGCTTVATLSIGDNVKVIPQNAFNGLTGLQGTLIVPDSVVSIGNCAFKGCSNLTKLVIGKSVREILSGSNWSNPSAFAGCSGITSLSFNADSCTVAGNANYLAFQGLTNLTSLTIGENVRVLPDRVFYNCSNVTGHLVIPDSVSYIGKSAFSGCSSLTGTLFIPNTVKTIEDYAFRWTSFDSLVIGENVSLVDTGAFYGCSHIKYVSYNADSCFVGNYPFQNCDSISSLYIGENVKYIPASAFSGKNKITGTLTIPDSVKTIGSFAFSSCSGLTKLVLGRSVESIGYGAFSNCTGLTSITSYNATPPVLALTSIEPFNSVNRNTPVYVPCASAQAYRNAWTYSSTSTNSYFYNIYETLQPYLLTAIPADTLQGTVQITTQPTCTEPAVIEATPNFFYVFDHWSDGNTDNPRTVALTQDTTLVAYFREYTLTIIPPSDTALGQVVVLQEPTAENPQAVVSVIPGRCYSFGSWASPANDWDPISYDNPMTLTLTQDTTIRAYFNSKVQVDITKSSDYICEGDSIIVTASGAESYMWTKAHWDYIEGRIIDDDTLGISDSIALTEGGYHYRVIGTDSTGCQGYYGLFSIDVYVYPPIIIAGKTEICEGHSTTLTVSSGEDYELTESLTNGIPYDWTISNNLQLYDLGGNHGNAIMFPAYNLPENSSGELLIPNVNLGFYDRRLTFDVAYRSYYWNCNEQLRVFISTVEDTSWVEVYSKTGNQLSNYNLNDSFYPDDSQWKHQSINLSNLFVNGNAKIKFVFSGGQGNNLWIDDIRVYSPYAEYFPYQYQWSNGSADRQQTFDSAGVYSVTVSDYICTSTDSVTVTVWQPDTTELTVDAATASYTLNGETFCTSGDYTQILQNIHGCDSVVNLHLNILSDTTVIYDTLCAGSKMIQQVYMSPDEYQQMLMQWEYQFGDSLPFELSYDTITNILTVKGVFISIFVQWETGYNEYGYPTYNYFDTTLYLNYNVWKDSAYYDDFSYTITYPSSAGCDSTVTWHRKILFSDNAEYIVTACGYHIWQGDSLFGLNGNTGDYQIFHAGDTLTQPGDYAQVYKCKNGCDSVILFHLNFIPASYEELSATACDSYTWNGITYTESGDYTMNSDTTFAVVRELYYENSAYFTWGYDDADGNFISFLPRGWNYWQVHEEYDAETGNYTYNYYYTDQYGVEHLYNPGDVVPYIDTVSGCKSVTLHLTINPSVTNLVEATACDSYTWNDSTYTTSGEYTQTFTAANGCDSVVTLYLTVNESKHTDTTAGSCGSYTWNDETYTTSGEYTQTFTAANGCDSVVTLHLTILPLPTPNIIGVTTVCEGQTATLTATGGVSYLWEDGTTTNTYSATVSGFYTVTATNAEGCSATASATVTVNPLPEVAITGNTAICPGGSTILTATGAATYMWSNGSSNASIPVNAFGQYSVIGTSAEGCFSTAAVTVLVSQPPVITINGNTNLCAGESTTLTATGGVSYMWSNGSTADTLVATTAGNWQVIGYNADGCSNMASVTVNVWQPASSDLYITAFDSCYMWFGTPRCESGNYTYTLQTIHGCDSVITLHLTLEDAITTEFSATSCDSYTWNGATYTVSGNYTQSFTAVNGNDSIVTLHLTVNNPVHTAVTAESCGAYDWNGQTYTVSGDYTYEHLDANDCTQVDTLHLTIFNPAHTAITAESCGAYDWNGLTYTVSGDYTYEHLDANGCTQVDTLHLTIFNPVHTAVTAESCGYYDWNGQTYTESGDYTQTLTAASGCDSVVTLHLTVHPSVSSDFSVECPDSCYTWNSETYCTSGDYTQTFQTIHGCDSVVTLHLTITVGIDDHNLAASMTVYPNPTTGIVNVQCTMNNVQVGTMEILVYDAFGRLLRTTDGVETQNFASLQTDTHGSSVQTQIDLSRYAPGVYLIKAVADGNVVAVRKIVKN